MSRLTNPFTWAAELIDSGFTTQDALRRVAEGGLYLSDPEDSTRHQEFDPLFKAPLWIDIAHHEVHEGDMYSSIIYDEDAANGHVIQIYFKTPAVADPQKRVHMTFAHEGSGEHQYQVIEGVTYSAGGADTDPLNRRRDSGATSMQEFKLGSTKSSNVITYTGGSAIWEDWSGAGKTTGGENRGTQEWILAPNVEYIVVLTSKAAGILLSQDVTFYEHTDG